MAPRSQNTHIVDNGGDSLPLLGFSTGTDEALSLSRTKSATTEKVAYGGGLGAAQPQLSPSHLNFGGGLGWLSQGLSVGSPKEESISISGSSGARPGLGGHKYS